jgi:hypothetical protein
MKLGKMILCGAVLAAGLLVGGQQAPAPPALVQTITVTMLEQRLADLKAGKEQAVANVNAFEGAIQECQHWLDALKAGQAAPPKPAPTPEKKK